MPLPVFCKLAKIPPAGMYKTAKHLKIADDPAEVKLTSIAKYLSVQDSKTS